MDTRNYLSKTVTVKVDRPMCSRHPSQDFLYPLNYGYIEGTVSGDGHELDAYILGVFEPVAIFTGQCIAVVHRTNDDDDKLVIVPDGVTYTDDQIKALTEFQERWFTSIILSL